MLRTSKAQIQREIAGALEKAKIHAIDGNRVDITIRNQPTVLRSVEVIGDASMLLPGQEVAIIWIDNRPVVVGSGVGSGTGGTTVIIGGGGSLTTHRHTSEDDGGLLADYLTPFSHHYPELHDLGKVVPHDNHANLGGLDEDHHPLYLRADGTRPLTGSLVLADELGSILSSNFSSGVSGFRIRYNGDAEFNNAIIRGELVSTVFSYQKVHASAGTLGVFKKAGRLRSELTTVAAPTRFSFELEDPASGHEAVFTIGDALWIKTGTDYAYLRATAVTDATTHFVYECEMPVGVVTNFPSETAVVCLGEAYDPVDNPGDGWLLLSADDANAPFMSVRSTQGEPWNDAVEVARLGNLNGILGRDTDIFGLFVGDPAGKFMSYDPADGLRIQSNKVVLDDWGLTVGATTLSEPQADRTAVKWLHEPTGQYIGKLQSYISGMMSDIVNLDLGVVAPAAGYAPALAIYAADHNGTSLGGLTINGLTNPASVSLSGPALFLNATSAPIEIGLTGLVKYDSDISGFQRIDGKSGFSFSMNEDPNVVATGWKGYIEVPYNCKITHWALLASGTTNSTVVLRKCTYATYGTWADIINMSVSGTNRNQANASVALAAGDILTFYVSANSAAVRLSCVFQLTKT